MKIHKHHDPSVIAPLLSTFDIKNAPALIIDTIKRGEDDEDVSYGGSYSGIPARKGKSIILRIYDCLGGRNKGILTWKDLPVKKVEKCNALEDDGETVELTKDGKGAGISLRAFEVATFKLLL